MASTIKLRTEAIGPITRTGLSKLVNEHGSDAKLAAALTTKTGINVEPGTVRSWRYRLNLRAAGKY